MLKEISLKESEGKTIKGVSEWLSESVVLVFTDETFMCLKATRGYDSCEISDVKFDVFDYPQQESIRLGIVSQEELDILKKNRDEKWRLQREEEERKMYTTLRKKFE